MPIPILFPAGTDALLSERFEANKLALHALEREYPHDMFGEDFLRQYAWKRRLNAKIAQVTA